MPSSPESARPVELPDLAQAGRHTVISAPAETLTFHPADPVADGVNVRPAPIFELTASGSVPDELVAPARAAAQAAGYAAGWAHGVRAARAVSEAEAHLAATTRARVDAERAAEVRRAVAAVDAAATALEQRSVPSAHEIEDLIVTSALTIAEALIGVSLRDDAVRGRAALTRALALAPENEDVIVALHPADLAIVDGSTAELELHRTITLVEDASLAPGDAMATCGATTIDARISAGLARVREVLA